MEKGDQARRACYDDYEEAVLTGTGDLRGRPRGLQDLHPSSAVGRKGRPCSSLAPAPYSASTDRTSLPARRARSCSRLHPPRWMSTASTPISKSTASAPHRTSSSVGSDVRGEVVLPEGEWDVVLFKDGVARTATASDAPASDRRRANHGDRHHARTHRRRRQADLRRWPPGRPDQSRGPGPLHRGLVSLLRGTRLSKYRATPEFPTFEVALPYFTQGPIVGIEILDEERFAGLYHVVGE